MLVTENLTEIQWQMAHTIAQILVKENADVNELGKAIAYLRAYSDRENAGSRFFDYLKTLAKNGRHIGHSQRTSDYYDSIEKACSQYLKAYKDDVAAMLQILGWASRLMRYYANAGSIGEITAPVIESVRQAEIAEVTQSQAFALNQILEAKVLKIKGNKVTYEILGVIKLTEKEPKKASSLVEKQTVQVKITALQNGSIKSVKCVD
ncbi:hypothetical protein [Allocoleopsis franciscana]|uniref:Uncharacterized protein n=1 Tax=Allocoleopsis franciscana PCC 7113 TaxID=1173027 RepID=K9WQU8_9CYAN|nr:hypothetical protein [Allocoleopsis franciscana]AFZ22166.1 hypothetical protein Mic7113_6593 [Allocoleopsis franciscana PCC 7113]